MKKIITSLSLIAAVSVLPLRAQTLLNETFADGNRSNQDPPNSLAWFSSQASGGLTATTGSMSITGSTTGARHAVAYFYDRNNPFTLDVGETITLSFNFSPTTGSLSVANVVRFGLFNSGGTENYTFAADGNNQNPLGAGYTGYVGRLDLGSGNVAVAGLIRNNSPENGALLTNSGAYTTVIAGDNPTLVSSPLEDQALTLGQVYDITWSVKRLSEDSIRFSASISGGNLVGTATVSYTETETVFTSFDTIGFTVFGSSGNGIGEGAFSNINITVVPEPSTVALGIVGVAGLFACYRRKAVKR